MLTQNEVEKYNEDGYLIPNFTMPEKELLEIEELHNSLIKKFPKFKNYCPALLLHDERFLKYCFNNEILNIIEQLIGKNFALWNSSFFAKPAFNGYATPWHQDGQYWPIRPLATCSVWLAVDAANEENGCLKYIPGSHKRKSTRKHNTNNDINYTLNQELDPSEFDEKDAYSLCLEEGQMALHDVYIVHGSGINVSANSRRGMTMRYMPTSSTFDRKLAVEQDKVFRLDHVNRTLFLMNGIDESGTNDFIIRS